MAKKLSKPLSTLKDWFGRRAEDSYTFYNPKARTLNWDQGKQSLTAVVLGSKRPEKLREISKVLQTMFRMVGVSKKAKLVTRPAVKATEVYVPLHLLKDEHTDLYTLSNERVDSFVGQCLLNAATSAFQTTNEYKYSLESTRTDKGTFNLERYLFTLLNTERVSQVLSKKNPGYMRFVQKAKDEQFDAAYEPMDPDGPLHLRMLDLLTRLIRFPKFVTDEELSEFQKPLEQIGRLLGRHKGLPDSQTGVKSMAKSMAKILFDFAPAPPPMKLKLKQGDEDGETPEGPTQELTSLDEALADGQEQEVTAQMGDATPDGEKENDPTQLWNEPEIDADEVDDNSSDSAKNSANQDQAPDESEQEPGGGSAGQGEDEAWPDDDEAGEEGEGAGGSESEPSWPEDEADQDQGGQGSGGSADGKEEDDENDEEEDETEAGDDGGQGADSQTSSPDQQEEEDEDNADSDWPEQPQASSAGNSNSSGGDDTGSNGAGGENPQQDDEPEEADASGESDADPDFDNGSAPQGQWPDEEEEEEDEDDDEDDTGFGNSGSGDEEEEEEDDSDEDENISHENSDSENSRSGTEDDEEEDEEEQEQDESDDEEEADHDASDIDDDLSQANKPRRSDANKAATRADDEPDDSDDELPEPPVEQDDEDDYSPEKRKQQLTDSAKDLANQLFDQSSDFGDDIDQDELDALNELFHRRPPTKEEKFEEELDKTGVEPNDTDNVSWTLPSVQPKAVEQQVAKYREVLSELDMTKSKVIQKLFTQKRNEQDFVLKGMKSGRFDENKIAEAAQGVANVYTKMGRTTTNNLCVVVLCDESASMAGSLDYDGAYKRYQNAVGKLPEDEVKRLHSQFQNSNKIGKARAAAIFLNECFAKVPGVEYFAYGHTADQHASPRDGAYTSTDMYVYREPGRRCHPMALGSMRPRNTNRDGKAIKLAAMRVRKFTANPGIFLVISDGMPSAYYSTDAGINDTRQQVKVVEKMGFHVVQIAIESGIPSEDMFTHFIEMLSIETLPKDLVRFMSKRLSRMMQTTVQL